MAYTQDTHIVHVFLPYVRSTGHGENVEGKTCGEHSKRLRCMSCGALNVSPLVKHKYETNE
jgi:hypothetical protein